MDSLKAPIWGLFCIMASFILGEKSQTNQTFTERGDRIPVTFIKTTPCYLIDIKSQDKDGHFAIKLGFGVAKNIKKPQQGEVQRVGIKTPLRFFKEFRLDKYQNTSKLIEENGKRGIMFGETKIFIGDELKSSNIFKAGDKVEISGTSKGKGFAGVVKRHGFAGGPRTHGQSDRERAPGSIGQTTTPGRVLKGKRMAGRMGGVRVTIKGLEIIETKEDGLVLKGVVPGSKRTVLEIKSSL